MGFRIVWTDRMNQIARVRMTSLGVAPASVYRRCCIAMAIGTVMIIQMRRIAVRIFYIFFFFSYYISFGFCIRKMCPFSYQLW